MDIIDKDKLSEVLKQINEHKAAIGLHRDALRDLINEVEMICDDVDDASHSLDYAADALSRLL